MGVWQGRGNPLVLRPFPRSFIYREKRKNVGEGGQSWNIMKRNGESKYLFSNLLHAPLSHSHPVSLLAKNS